MSQRQLILILIANLLVCPFRCNWVATHTGIGEESSRVACCCCAHDDPPPASQSSGEIPIDDCGCHGCLCDGAVLETGLDLSESAIEFSSWWYGFPPRLIAPTSSALLFKQSSHLRTGKYLSGRAARIAHQSWRI